MNKQALITQLEISDRTWRRWCNGLGIETNKPSYSEQEISLLAKLKEQLDSRVGFDDAIAELTGKRPEPKQAPGRYSNLPAQLQPKTVATAMVQQFDQQVMEEFFKLLQQPLSKQQIDQYFQSADADVIDGYLLESAYEE